MRDMDSFGTCLLGQLYSCSRGRTVAGLVPDRVAQSDSSDPATSLGHRESPESRTASCHRKLRLSALRPDQTISQKVEHRSTFSE